MTPYAQDLLSLFVALLLGSFIGLERELSDKAAGLRTNILICVGSCLFAILSRQFTDMPGTDMTRIAAQIVTGIGFLGAGAIMREGEHVTGLTTAATIWVVAAIGVACGFGFFYLAGATTVITLVIQSVFPHLDSMIDELRQRHTFKITSDLDDDGLEQIKTIFRDADVKVLRRKLMKRANLYYSEWYVAGPRLEQKSVVRLILDNKHVRELSY
ncbi:MAG: magnesium transporter MgtC [Elusimicrobia bacterium CG11_big_fil_rev_8_21_14_0_20_64_6]|nr:MAG: magnesium transporter MgtC [Elusimicrobia bacterium CG11_big_fil_rev_8_21_14_0_20_64_6]